MEPSNMEKNNNNKRTNEYDKSIITYDVSTAQCENGTVKYHVFVTWYSWLPTSWHRTPKKKGGVQ